MIKFYRNKSSVLLSVFNKTLMSKGSFPTLFEPGAIGISISGPGEDTYVPYVYITGFTRKPISIGKPKGWSKFFTVSNITTEEGFTFTEYIDDYVTFKYCRGSCLLTYPKGNTEKQEIWVIKDVVHVPSGKTLGVETAPLYNKDGVYRTPEIFVKGIVEMSVNLLVESTKCK